MPDELFVDPNKTLLIIGKGATNFGLKEIVYSEDYDEVLDKYGESDLSKAFADAKKIGAPYVFLMNLQKHQDYFDVAGALKQNDFAYISLASVMLSDTFQNDSDGGMIHSLLAYILGLIGENHNTTWVVTDKHASLYEDIDQYLEDMRNTKKTFLSRCSSRANLRNVIFVMNNLKKHKTASTLVAAALCSTEINEYPTSKYFDDTVFDIDSWDNPDEIAYFKKNSTRETTIENFINLYQAENAPEKIVFIDRIMKHLERDLDFSEFKGRRYTPYQKLLFSRALTKTLNSLKKICIKDYSIESIEVYLDKENPGTVVMLARIDVIPMNCLEVCSLTKEVILA